MAALTAFKGAVYESETAAGNEDGSSTIDYKFNALRLLEIGHALNMANYFGFVFGLYPRASEAYDKASMLEVFKTQSLVDTYYSIRNFVVHSIPVISSLYMTFWTKAVFLATDWDLIVGTAIAYFFVSHAYSVFSGVKTYYIIDW